MKKLIALSIFIFTCVISNAQERTVQLNNGQALDITTIKTIAYNWASSSDNLVPTTRDTIDFELIISNYYSGPINVTANVTFNPILLADTTVSVGLLCKEMNSQSYSTLVAGSLSSAVTTTVQKSITTLGVVNETIVNDTTKIMNHASPSLKSLYYSSVIKNPLLYYRYLKVRCILQGNDSLGTGVKISRVELNFH